MDESVNESRKLWATTRNDDTQLDDKHIAARMAQGLKRAFSTPSKPQKINQTKKSD